MWVLSIEIVFWYIFAVVGGVANNCLLSELSKNYIMHIDLPGNVRRNK